MRSVAADGARTLEMTAGQVITRTVQVAHPGTIVAKVMTMMTIGRYRHLPVIDQDTLVGLRRREGPHHGCKRPKTTV
jgi:CBS domain-containing protein